MKLLPIIIKLIMFFIITAVAQAIYIIAFLGSWFPIISIALLTGIFSKILFKRTLLQSIFISLIISEIAWALLFMPFGYLIQSAILLIGFYVLWDILKSQHKKAFKKLVINDLLFGLGLLTLLFITSKWLPV